MLINRIVQTQLKRVFRIPNYVRTFGLLAGLKLVFAVERDLPAASVRMRSFRAPGFPSPVHLRDTVGDHSIFWQCLVMRQYDVSGFPQAERLQRQYLNILSEGRVPVIVDAGGNIGLAAFWFAKKFPQACIVSVEPDANNFDILRRNIAVFGNRVMPVHGAVTETPRMVRIINPDAGSSGFQIGPADTSGEGTVQGFTIDALTRKIERGQLFIVKIDIEGSQRALFSANTDWIDEAQLIAIEIDDWQFPWQATCETFFRAMSSRRFDYLLSGENMFCFRHLSQPSEM
jgi:FkbM family methyltransferase